MRYALIFVWSIMAAAAAEHDPAQVLMRISIKVRVRAASLPNYTCVETVNRDYYRTKAATLSRTCPAVLAERQHPAVDTALRLVLTDRLRLDVTLTDSGEIYSWVGASKFDGEIGEVVHQGPIATGAFGAFLAVVFGQDISTFHFLGNTVVDGRNLMEYSFQVAKEASRYKVRAPGSWVYTAYSGTFQADAETGEVVRMTVQSAELPPATGSCQTTTTMEFRPTRIGDGEFLLPKQGRQRFVDINGDEAENTTTLADCREYRGDSTITFFPAPETAGGKEQNNALPPPLPSGLPFTFELTTPISAGTAAGGDPFTGRLVSALRDKQGKIVAPARAVVEGRLLRVEIRHTPPQSTTLVLNLQTVEIGGVKVPLTAERDWVRGRTQSGKVAVLLPRPWELNASVFQFAQEHAVMKAGSRSEWLTK